LKELIATFHPLGEQLEKRGQFDLFFYCKSTLKECANEFLHVALDVKGD